MKASSSHMCRRTLVCGGRHYEDYATVKKTLDAYQPIYIISGGATGADSLAVKYANERGLPVKVFMADWNRHGELAGLMRNQQMLDEGDIELVIAFPGGSGTADMMVRTLLANIPLVKITQEQ
jgi:YspA, cpYpsA-related SLOG family